jgi:hypothetical protein
MKEGANFSTLHPLFVVFHRFFYDYRDTAVTANPSGNKTTVALATFTTGAPASTLMLSKAEPMLISKSISMASWT